jgi:hypothetical protein
VTTLDRIDFRTWAPPVSVVDDDAAYLGRHRRAGARALSLLRMFYRPRHRMR